jgi:hypothetical protein
MKEPTGVFNHTDIGDDLFAHFRQLPQVELDEFLQRCKFVQYKKLDGAITDEDRVRVQERVRFVEEFRNFFKTLLTSSHK